MIQITTEVIKTIRERLKAAQERQKGYVDNRRRPLEFEVGDYVFLKVSPIKSVVRFEKRGKLSPRCIGPYEILMHVRKMAYRLVLPPRMSHVHNTFHASMLRKYVADPRHVLEDEDVDVSE
ncbi:hypothetical protein MLD38_005009 [Melastoma candidum]|uniref:Uncharacterized protein n=1 Tax=Melastoma candidum TaxID=119954 RepID=A0ACB9S7Y0_9MYRT|nr:hypothetical protein MLD38_005009 [Melastoma candidum]